jgi:hypothetical protein
MTESLRYVETAQVAWAQGTPRDPGRRGYAATLGANLFLGRLRGATEAEFRAADGAELEDTARRPAKMRSLVSSSALAVNFFDAWRDSGLGAVGAALGLGASAVAFRFEYKPDRYPVGPRSPNFDLLLSLDDGRRVAVESKFTEPFRAPGADAPLSPKYFPDGVDLWDRAGLVRAQQLASRLSARWHYLDAAQLLKHMLGLASESEEPATLLYLWYDTGLEDARKHRGEVATFAEQVTGDRVGFVSCTYQEAFAALPVGAEPVAGWREYLAARYFTTRP